MLLFFQTHYNDWPVAASHSAAGQEKMSLFEVPSFESQHRSLLLSCFKPGACIETIQRDCAYYSPAACPYFALFLKIEK